MTGPRKESAVPFSPRVASQWQDSRNRRHAMTDHKIGSREEWQAAREELLRREKEHTKTGDELARRAPRAAVGAGREGVPVRHRRRHADAGAAVRRALPAPRLPLHVRAELRGRLPHLLVDGGRLQRPPSAPPRARPDDAARLARAAREAPGVQAEDGLEHSLGLLGRQRLQLRLRRLVPRRAGARADGPCAGRPGVGPASDGGRHGNGCCGIRLGGLRVQRVRAR